jgi:hypothetical protein
MDFQIGEEFVKMCQEIIAENKSPDEWAEIESDDMFQSDNYEGGFEAIEMEFCFSVFVDDVEYWFQISLEEAERIAARLQDIVDIRPAET